VAADEERMSLTAASAASAALTTAQGGDLSAAIDGGIRSLYQPIVQLATGQTVAYEALARGPQGSPLESPLQLFAAARTEGRLAELDLACARAAITGAADGRLHAPATLFVNAEPEALSTGAPQLAALAAGSHLPIVVEITERALTARPAQLLEAVDRLRAAGFGIALDDVGADERSLALLPLLHPDIVKLDISLIHSHPSRLSGEVMNGVCAYAEATGAGVVAEGIEDERHLLAAESLGATLAQGWYFGRPGPLPANPHLAGSATSLRVPPRAVPGSPVALVHRRRRLRIGRKDVLLSASRALEAKALQMGPHGVVAAAFQDVRHFTPATRARYERLADRSALVAALGVGMGSEPMPGVHGADLEPNDILRHEWNLAVLGPHYAGALVARDLGDTGPDRDRRFEFVLTFDRQLVIDVAAALIGRVSSATG
jgi:EAL domain-containing protein (putative c-di-GMP-specific phosphodiesterase class I)